MFSKNESSIIRHEFWTTFGQYMRPILSSEGMKVNWINYHTKIKDLYFRMDATGQTATIAISIEHADIDIQELYFEQFLELKTLLHETLEEEWNWQLHGRTPDGRIISRIYKELQDVSILNKDQWSDLISFFKPRMIALDSFWENGRYSFESLK